VSVREFVHRDVNDSLTRQVVRATTIGSGRVTLVGFGCKLCSSHWPSTFHSILRGIIKLCNYKAISDNGYYMMVMATTIQVSDELADKLYSHKCRGESYDDVLKRMLELDEL
jgi:hypothetical protein